MENKKNGLGFTRFEMASIKRTYKNSCLVYKKMATLAGKINRLEQEYNTLKQQTDAWEAPVKALSKKVLGAELTSEEILATEGSKENLYALRPELRPESDEGNGEQEAENVQSEPEDTDSEVQPEPEHEPESLEDWLDRQ